MEPALYHTTLGTGGPAVLALHGGLGWDHTSLRPWLDPLAEHATLTYADLRGNGRSPEPEDWDQVTNATWADDVEALRQRLQAERGGHERVVVFGHSYGALIAQEVALRHPDHVAGLVLCGPVSWAGHLEGAVGRAFARAEGPAARALEAALSAPPASDGVFAALLPDLLPIYVHDPASNDLAAYAARMTVRVAPLRRSFYGLLQEYDGRERAHAIEAPTLVLSGRHDWIAPPEESPADLLAALPDAEGHVFESSGHLPFLEEPEAFVQVVSDWLATHTDTPSR